MSLGSVSIRPLLSWLRGLAAEAAARWRSVAAVVLVCSGCGLGAAAAVLGAGRARAARSAGWLEGAAEAMAPRRTKPLCFPSSHRWVWAEPARTQAFLSRAAWYCCVQQSSRASDRNREILGDVGVSKRSPTACNNGEFLLPAAPVGSRFNPFRCLWASAEVPRGSACSGMSLARDPQCS